MILMHNSSIAKYRDPMGAIPTGGQTMIRFEAPNDGRRVTVIFYDRWNERKEYDMTFVGDLWQYEYTAPMETGVVWYHFAVYGQPTVYYGVEFGKTGGVGQEYADTPVSFQLTVYDAAFETPEWFRGCVMYQIFPDRFCRGDGKNAERGLAYHHSMGRQAVFHKRWDEQPLYTPLDGQEQYTPCDFYGGDLKGIEKNLPYLKEMGIGCLYLNPIVEAESNHRYDTADYKNVDPILGTNDDFRHLCRRAQKYGIRILLDGVYSHTGSDSRYFNKKDNYPQPGAYQGRQSPYYNWYQFGNNRDEYKSWWGFDTLPEVDETQPDWINYVISGKDSVFAHWMRHGAAGYRLDVADELPDETIFAMRKAVKKGGRDKVLLGEVWEDATTKESYGVKRQYAMGLGLDSVMNYPFRTACINYLLGRGNAYDMKNFLLSQRLAYPMPMYYSLMNLLSSHDVARIRTVLATGLNGDELTREQQGTFQISVRNEMEGAKKMLLAQAIQMALPGVPSVYYGDEWGMDGMKDPFNRGPFIKIDSHIYEETRQMALIRNGTDALKTGFCSFAGYDEDVLLILRFVLDGKDAFGRRAENACCLAVINRGTEGKRLQVDVSRLTEGVESACLDKLLASRFKRAHSLLHKAKNVHINHSTVQLTLGAGSYDWIQLE